MGESQQRILVALAQEKGYMRFWLEQRERFEDEWGEEALFDFDMDEEHVRRQREAGRDIPWGFEGGHSVVATVIC